jgi:hypothetical protein
MSYAFGMLRPKALHAESGKRVFFIYSPSSRSAVAGTEEHVLTAQEELWMRCPRLGGEAPFSYCLREGGELPCQRIVTCWQAFFPVETWLRKVLSPQKWEQFVNKVPKEKVSSLVELIQEAQRNVGEG